MRHIIVDGYNVIRSRPSLHRLEGVSLEHARETLLQTLASAPRLANDKVVVVFDGRFGDRLHVGTGRKGRVDILFSARGQTADEVIVDEARKLGATEHVVVVSDDMEIQDRSVAAGCEVSSSDNLLSQVPGRLGSTRAEELDEDVRSLSTVKRGNPRRSSRKTRKKEVRF